MTRRWRIRLLVTATALPLLVCCFDRCMMCCWVGHTDLEVEFIVSDAATDSPIPGAQVEIQSEGGFYEQRDKQEFVVVAGPDGVARTECRQSMCFGTSSGLGFTNTFVVHLPWWRFRVVADGREPSEWKDLDVPEYIHQARRVGHRRAKLEVLVSLHKGL